MTNELHSITVQSLPSRELAPGFHARMIHTDSMTIVYLSIESGSKLPAHAHVHEQITQVLKGTLELHFPDKNVVVQAGETIVIPSNVQHGATAHAACEIIDVFSPVREDYR